MRRLLVDATAIRRFPEFRRLWLGFSVSQIGAQLGVVAISYQVYKITGSVFDVGLVSLIQLGPTFVGAILGGSIADAMDRRRLLIITETSMAASAAGLAFNSMSGHSSLWLLYLLAAASAAATGVDNPTRTAVMMTIVDPSSFISANAVRQLTQQMSLVVGPALGGVLLGSLGVTAVYWVNAASFASALVTVVAVSPQPPVGGGARFGLASVAEGFAFLRGRPALQGCFIADLNAMILGMPTALFPAIGIAEFHGGAGVVGLLFAAPGAGALVASLVSGWTGQIRRPGVAVCVAITIWGAAITAFGFSRVLWLSLVLLGIAGGADVISAVFRSTIIQVEAPDRLRGRISAIQIAVVTSGPRLGNMEAGSVAALAGLQASVVSGGLGCIVGIVVIARLLPGFVRYRLHPSGQRSEVEAVDRSAPGGPGASSDPAADGAGSDV